MSVVWFAQLQTLMGSPAGVGPTTERTLFLLQAVLKQGPLKFQALPKARLQGDPANPLHTVSRSFLFFSPLESHPVPK